MNSNRVNALRGIALVATLGIAGCGAESPAPAPSGESGGRELSGSYAVGTYAEKAYASYQQAARGKIAFVLEITRKGALAEISARPFADLLGVPAHWVVFNTNGTQIDEVLRGPRNRDIDEWSNTPPSLAGVEEAGLPIADGAYRLLDVAVDMNGEITKHKALEICWQKQGHCAVVDPVLVGLDSFHRNVTRFEKEGLVKQTVIDTPLGLMDDTLRATTCSSAWYKANYGRITTSFTRTWAANKWNWYALAGNVVGWIQLGKQQQGLGCHVVSGACKAYTFGQSDAGSCWAGFLNSCDQDNRYYAYASGNQSRVGAQAKGVFASPSTGSSVTAGISGSGLSASITFSLSSGSQVSLGGMISDSCVWQ